MRRNGEVKTCTLNQKIISTWKHTKFTKRISFVGSDCDWVCGRELKSCAPQITNKKQQPIKDKNIAIRIERFVVQKWSISFTGSGFYTNNFSLILFFIFRNFYCDASSFFIRKTIYSRMLNLKRSTIKWISIFVHLLIHTWNIYFW